METLSKGNAAEAAILTAFVRRDFRVLIPFGGGHPYDLVVHLPNGEFVRVQCKTARDAPGCLCFNTRSTDHGHGRLPYAGLADIFGVYWPTRAAVYLVPVSEVPGFEGRLRIEPTRNNQRLKVRYATDYEFDRWTADRLARVLRGEHRHALSLVA